MDWYQQQAILAHQKTKTYQETLLTRENQTLLQRLKTIATRAALLAAGTTSNLQPQISSTKQVSQPPPQIPPNPIEPYLVAIEGIIKQAERRLDHEDGLITRLPEIYINPKDELDAELKEWEGYHPGVVAFLAPHLGSYRAIERARIRLGLRPVDGTPKNPSTMTRN